MMVEGWRVAVPVKGGARAKSRLGGSPHLALAMAADCLAALAGCASVRDVVVVTADPAAALLAVDRGLRVGTDSGRGLNDAAMAAAAGWPGRYAVMLADIPAVRAADVGHALEAAAAVFDAARASMAFVPDVAGTGTVLLAASNAQAMRPGFGPGSARIHESYGAIRLDIDLPRLRTDVDTAADLRAVTRLGCGPNTAAALGLLDTSGSRGKDGSP